MAYKRLMNVASHLGSDKKTDWTTASLPTFDDLPAFRGLPGCAWSVWGDEDQLGTVNLLTDAVVKRAASEEIRTGKSVSLNWPLNFPNKPMFGRKAPEINMIQKKADGHLYARDDEIHINTQSGTQWDGLRHFPILEHEIFYNNTPARSLQEGFHPIPDPQNVDPIQAHIGIQNWSNHGICGRGVLLDIAKFLSKDGVMSYDPWTTHAITMQQLQDCAKAQGVKFRRGDILILRVGFIKKFYESSQEAKDALREKPETFAGIEQSEEMKQFLWNNHFAAIASDQPALERWPTPEGVPHMHQTILGLWGMPIGEFFDVEKLSEVCAEQKRYTFFFSSWPLNIIGGAASPPNAAAFF
ncbi:putative cyclase-domain-containing protein [Roridomyces roridus]|uniref:Cyclase-domain-containing protein n=1 Tax=Roridomyces roridus TaxID=1738132 RepID=A0AAD7FCI9_9AGAR|nr:putative cyclase-domain-containing protein [Roridomyces roridus]